MTPDTKMMSGEAEQSAAPSADFIHAISEFLDTNPDDLLLELGYYEREEDSSLLPVLTPQV